MWVLGIELGPLEEQPRLLGLETKGLDRKGHRVGFTWVISSNGGGRSSSKRWSEPVLWYSNYYQKRTKINATKLFQGVSMLWQPCHMQTGQAGCILERNCVFLQ